MVADEQAGMTRPTPPCARRSPRRTPRTRTASATSTWSRQAVSSPPRSCSRCCGGTLANDPADEREVVPLELASITGSARRAARGRPRWRAVRGRLPRAGGGGPVSLTRTSWTPWAAGRPTTWRCAGKTRDGMEAARETARTGARRGRAHPTPTAGVRTWDPDAALASACTGWCSTPVPGSPTRPGRRFYPEVVLVFAVHRPGGAPPRAAAAQPVRVLHLPGQLTAGLSARPHPRPRNSRRPNPRRRNPRSPVRRPAERARPGPGRRRRPADRTDSGSADRCAARAGPPAERRRGPGRAAGAGTRRSGPASDRAPTWRPPAAGHGRSAAPIIRPPTRRTGGKQGQAEDVGDESKHHAQARRRGPGRPPPDSTAGTRGRLRLGDRRPRAPAPPVAATTTEQGAHQQQDDGPGPARSNDRR